MGRPLKKSFFGSPSTGGKQLVLSYVWMMDSTAAETGYYVVRQVGTGRYQVTNGTKVGVVKLTDALPTIPGEGCIEIKPFGSTVREYAKVIYNRSVRTFDDNTYKWTAETATEVGYADLPFEAFLTAAQETSADAAINNASTGSAIVTLITGAPATYFVSDAKVQFDAIVTSGGGRQAAVGDYLAGYKTINGPFTSVSSVRDQVAYATKTEFNKNSLIVAVDAAATEDAMALAFTTYLPAVVADRTDLIKTLNAGNTAAKAQATTLKSDSLTVTFGQLNDLIKKGEDLSEVYAAILVSRNAQTGKKFNGTTKMITAINSALAA